MLTRINSLFFSSPCQSVTVEKIKIVERHVGLASSYKKQQHKNKFEIPLRLFLLTVSSLAFPCFSVLVYSTVDFKICGMFLVKLHNRFGTTEYNHFVEANLFKMLLKVPCSS